MFYEYFVRKSKKEYVLLFVFVLFAFSVRLIHSQDSDFFRMDEATYAGKTRHIHEDWSNLFNLQSPYAFGILPWGSLSMHLFGVNEFALRFVSIFFGSFSLIPFYFLSKIIFNKKKAFFSTIIFASLPTHIAFSKVYYLEALSIFYSLTASYFLLKCMENNGKNYLILHLFFAANAFLTKYYYALIPYFAVLLWKLIQSKTDMVKPLLKNIFLMLIFTSFLYLLFFPVSTVFKQIDGTQLGILNRYPPNDIISGLSKNVVDTNYRTFWFYEKDSNILSSYFWITCIGLIILLYRSFKSKNYTHLKLVILYGLVFSPIQFGNDKYPQYIMMLTPLMAWLITEFLMVFDSKEKLKKMVFYISIFSFVFAPIYLLYSANNPFINYHLTEVAIYSKNNNLTVYSAKPVLFTFYTDINFHKIPKYWEFKAGIENGSINYVVLGLEHNGGYKFLEKKCISINDKVNIPRKCRTQFLECLK